eukprot:565335-Prymnesium_polylepis.1
MRPGEAVSWPWWRPPGNIPVFLKRCDRPFQLLLYWAMAAFCKMSGCTHLKGRAEFQTICIRKRQTTAAV